MKKRLLELDTLRGISILGMILVITPGDWSKRFHWMNHAEWIGFPLSDMIFPTFLFCVGMSIAISFHKKIKHNVPYVVLIKKILIRTILLFLIGVFINGFPSFDWQHIRISGVLQRIGISYCIVSLIWLFIQSRKRLLPLTFLLSIAFFIGAFYFILLYYIPIPSFGITGHSSANSWPSYIDQNIFGIQHLWMYGTTDGIVTYDPEGLLASLPASINIIFGVVFGQLYILNSKWYNLKYIMLVGVLLLIVGYFLNYFSIMPIIKKIWTSSFALFSSGFSLLILSVIQLLITQHAVFKRVFYPFIVYGSNALLAFIISNALMPIMDIPLINGISTRQGGFQFFNTIIPSQEWSSFLYGSTFLVLLFCLLNILYKKKLFLKL